MKTYMLRGLVLLLLLSLVGIAQTSEAQVLKRLKNRAKERIEEKIGQKQDKAIDKALDGEEEEEEEGQGPSQAADGAQTPTEAAAVAKLKPGEGAWANYDFIPGERALYVDYFTADNVGDFPRRLEFKSGNMEVVEWGGRRWLRAEDGEFFINLPEELPQRFTIEYDLTGYGNAMAFEFDEPNYSDYIEVGQHFASLRSGDVNGRGEFPLNTDENIVRIRIAVDGKYVKLYQNEKRVLNVPNANMGRSNRIYVNMNGWTADQPRLISDVRVMAGGRKLYDAIVSEGRVVTQGILFDTGSDQIRPESTPTLKEIGQMLKEHTDLRLGIEGHTDNVGSADSNKGLSERRAASVKAYLVEAMGIDASRIESAGYGAEKPVAPNDTPEGRQMNRRVELVKL